MSSESWAIRLESGVGGHGQGFLRLDCFSWWCEHACEPLFLHLHGVNAYRKSKFGRSGG